LPKEIVLYLCRDEQSKKMLQDFQSELNLLPKPDRPRVKVKLVKINDPKEFPSFFQQLEELYGGVYILEFKKLGIEKLPAIVVDGEKVSEGKYLSKDEIREILGLPVKIEESIIDDEKLMRASEKGDAETVEILLKQGANPNYRNKDGRTPLHFAAYNGRADVAELLIRHGADVNARDNDGRTPLRIAAYNGHVDVVKLLLERGADLNAKNSENKTPLDVARERGQSDVARVIEEFTRMPSELFEAVKSGDAARVKELLEKGADVNARDNKGWTPLHLAAQKGHADVAELLIKNGADVNAKNNYGWTPLYAAAQEGHADVAELLIRHGADVNARDNDGRTPLRIAAYNGRVEVVKLLLERGADPTVRGNDGRSPLDVARESGQSEVARVIEEFIGSRLAILGVEAPELYAGEWDARAICPVCGNKLVFIKTLNRYYCFKCKDYR